MYTKKVMKHFLNPKFHKKIKKFNGIGQVGNTNCGDIMKVYINVEKDIIKDIYFETLGCVAAIASSDVMCELAKGKTIKQASKIKAKDIVKKLGQLPVIKFHCSVLGMQALQDAIKDYKENLK